MTGVCASSVQRRAGRCGLQAFARARLQQDRLSSSWKAVFSAVSKAGAAGYQRLVAAASKHVLDLGEKCHMAEAGDSHQALTSGHGNIHNYNVCSAIFLGQAGHAGDSCAAATNACPSGTGLGN